MTIGGIIYWKKKPRKGFTSKHELADLADNPKPNRRERRALAREEKGNKLLNLRYQPRYR